MVVKQGKDGQAANLFVEKMPEGKKLIIAEGSTIAALGTDGIALNIVNNGTIANVSGSNNNDTIENNNYIGTLNTKAGDDNITNNGTINLLSSGSGEGNDTIINNGTYNKIATGAGEDFITDTRNNTICKLMGWDGDSGITNAKYAGDNITSFERDGIAYNITYKNGQIYNVIGKKNGYKVSSDIFGYNADGTLKGKESYTYKGVWGTPILSINSTKYDSDGKPTLEYIRNYQNPDGTRSDKVVSYTYKSANYEVTNYCKKSTPCVSNYTKNQCTIRLTNGKYLNFSKGENVTINKDGTIEVIATDGSIKKYSGAGEPIE